MLISSRLILDVSTHHLRMRENRNLTMLFHPSYNFSSLKLGLWNLADINFTVSDYYNRAHFRDHPKERHLIYKARGSVIKFFF